MAETERYISMERRIERATLDDLLALYATENAKRRELQERIHATHADMDRDDSLELVNEWNGLEDDCLALARAIADRMTDPAQLPQKELISA